MKLILASCVLFLIIYVASAYICTCWLSSIDQPCHSTLQQSWKEFEILATKPVVESCILDPV